VTVPHFSDYAANERTFLAWVRTAIAVMAFGFLVERFDIFLKVTAHALGARMMISDRGELAGSIVGLLLILSGAMMVLIAMHRFRQNQRAIAAEDAQAPANIWLDMALAGLIVLLGIGLAGYLGRTLVLHHT
jgi:putative membrane protein